MTQIIADLHIHSKYSRATSERMDLRILAHFGAIKGLNIIGTGDATHPKWIGEISKQLECDDGSDLYRLRDKPENSLRFLATAEVATVFSDAEKTRKIHHLLLLPSLEIAEQVNDSLGKEGNLAVDGRPILNISPPELVERLMQVSDAIEVIPAHVWTPWWSVFGSMNGYDSVEECYKEQTNHIHALETGLSSDPPMNWRLSRLDRFTLVSNSDCHSPEPHRLGREANIFQLERLTYSDIVQTIRRKDPKCITTIETKPEYGKYHWTGHRNCGISMPPSKAIKLDNKCPRCGRKLTVGVEQRVEELADRPAGFESTNMPKFLYLLPLQELISTALSNSTLGSRKVQELYNLFINSLGDEFTILMNTPLDSIKKAGGVEVVNLIRALRENTLKIDPGYDGVYGKILHINYEFKEKKDAITKGLERWIEPS